MSDYEDEQHLAEDSEPPAKKRRRSAPKHRWSDDQIEVFLDCIFEETQGDPEKFQVSFLFLLCTF